MSVIDAARTRIRAQRKRLTDQHLAQKADRIGSRPELAEPAELETVADLVVSAGGEVALGNRRRFIGTVRTRDSVTVDTAERLMERRPPQALLRSIWTPRHRRRPRRA